VELTLEMCEVGLLVEAGLVETERVNDIDNGLCAVLDTLLGLLSGRVGADVEVLGTETDLLAVGLVDGTAYLLEVVRVGNELVTSDDVLKCIYLVKFWLHSDVKAMP